MFIMLRAEGDKTTIGGSDIQTIVLNEATNTIVTLPDTEFNSNSSNSNATKTEQGSEDPQIPPRNLGLTTSRMLTSPMYLPKAKIALTLLYSRKPPMT